MQNKQTPSSLLQVENLSVSFPAAQGLVRAVDGVTWQVGAGECLAIVGESGSGKSVSALAVMGLLPPTAKVSGSIVFDGRELLQMPERERRQLRGGEIAMVFQDPLSALNPVYQIGEQIAEAIEAHQRISHRQAQQQAIDLLHEVGIANPQQRAKDYPHHFSGGMRQRVVIAMALANNPRVLIADEPTTALDVTVQAQVMDLLAELRERRNTATILITHDLGVVAGHADRVLVMYAGRVAETSHVDELFQAPRHHYTHGLLASMTRIDTARQQRLDTIPGQAPSLIDLPQGCAFHPRCPHATELCRTATPALLIEHGHTVACHHCLCAASATVGENAGENAGAQPPASPAPTPIHLLLQKAEGSLSASAAHQTTHQAKHETTQTHEANHMHAHLHVYAQAPRLRAHIHPHQHGTGLEHTHTEDEQLAELAAAASATATPAVLPHTGGHTHGDEPPEAHAQRHGAAPVVLDIAHLHKTFPLAGGRRGQVHHALRDVSLHIHAGETVGLVGESGCGKSTLGRCALRLLEPASGSIHFRGQDLLAMNAATLRAARRHMQMVFQDPLGCMDPRFTVRELLAEPFAIHGVDVGDEVEALLHRVGLTPEHANRRPHEFSGGQLQRIGIARAIALNPALVICDEPVSALDVSVQAQVINLLCEIQEQSSLAYLFIAHDLSVVRHIADRVAVMYLGEIVEMAEVNELFTHPQHPYTRALLSAVPIPSPAAERARTRIMLHSDAQDSACQAAPRQGCAFAPRCPVHAKLNPAQRAHCQQAVALRDIGTGGSSGGHLVRCAFA